MMALILSVPAAKYGLGRYYTEVSMCIKVFGAGCGAELLDHVFGAVLRVRGS
jgi:hypothetical protein